MAEAGTSPRDPEPTALVGSTVSGVNAPARLSEAGRGGVHVQADAAEANCLIGPSLERHPARVTHADGATERLAYYTKTCIGKFKFDWEADAFPGTTDVIRWRATAKPPNFPTRAEADAKCPSVATVDHERLADPPGGARGIQTTWLGHACFLVQVGGVNILTDPVWADRCSPVQFAGPKRYVPPPVGTVAGLPRIDVVTISHNHYDHLDHATVRALREAFQPRFVVPLGMKKWFRGLKWAPTAAETERGIRDPADALVTELDWWQAVTLPPREAAGLQQAALAVTFTPVQHWSMRTGPWDRNGELWGGFVFEADVSAEPGAPLVRRAFHCGDTGYTPLVFRQIGDVFRRFDLALIPIGAYEPRWFMHVQHVDPEEAVKIHCDLRRPRLSLGMHWGTWILTDEPIDEPPRLLAEARHQYGIPDDEFVALKHGETVAVKD